MTRLFLIAFLFITVVGCDQASKSLVRETLSVGQGYSYLFDTLRIEHAQNPGAFLNLGASLPPVWRYWIFNISVGVFLLGLAVFIYAQRLAWVTTAALVLFLAGGVGNLIDRFRFGFVTDFLIVGYGPLKTGIFNVADFAIVLGVLLMLLPASLFRRNDDLL